MMDKFKQHENRNSLTAPENNYKRYNVEIIDAYVALHPLSLSKLSIALFNAIMDTKIYDGTDANENSRIYNNQHITLEDLLNRCHPVKYTIDKKPVSNDFSNLMSRIYDLDEGNIFYVWKFGKPISYLFIMERDIGVWKYFNPQAFVPPKTLKKIVARFDGMVDTMVRFENEQDRLAQKSSVEFSFVDKFLSHIIGKMNGNIASSLPLWDGTGSAKNYLDKLSKALDGMGDYDGMQESPVFYQRLPNHLVSKIKGENGEARSEKMDEVQLMKDLVPENEDIVQERSSRKKKSKEGKISGGSILPEKTTFKTIDPFSNCNQMLKYYRTVIRSHNRHVKFYPPDVERIFAAQVIDVLIKSGREGDKDFLRSWIKYYVGSYLQGDNILKPDRTSLSNFKKTFASYDGKYFRG